MSGRRAWLVLALVLALPPAAPAAEPGWTVEALMARLAAVRQVDSTFIERKTLSVLQSPLLSSGILRYRAPDYLLKQVLQPFPESYEVAGGRLFVQIPGRPREEVDLDRYRPLRVLADSLRATLAGDLAALSSYCRITLSGQAEGWTLRLEPRDEDVRRHVAQVLIGGSGAGILAVETRDADGDVSEMTITPAAE